MTDEQLRTLDVEVAMTVFDLKWFCLRHGPTGDPAKSFKCIRLLTPDQSARYPWVDWSIEAMTDEDGMALFRAEKFASQPQNAMYTGPEYSTDHDAAWDMEEEVKRRRLTAEYGAQVACMILEACHAADTRHTYYDFIHASPELRCRAALSAVRGANTKSLNARTAARKTGRVSTGAKPPGRAQRGR